jgi:hypothetical protein
VRLTELGAGPFGFLDILSCASVFGPPMEDGWQAIRLENYFAFCLACHHATVATFVPTDVDTKIRGLLWRETRDPEALRRMFAFTLRALDWSIEGISTRATALAGVGPVSGHNGEQLSVLAGALGAFLKAGDAEYARRAHDAIVRELEREAAEFRFAERTPGAELDLLRIAMSLTHNAGDLDQGISFWPQSEQHAAARALFHRLAHENTKPFGGAFAAAAEIYRRAMSAEGHRHYPLRAVKSLRRSPAFLLPLGPFFDDWGAVIGSHPELSDDERAEVLSALITGCRKIPGQRGYYRAIHGLQESLGSRFGSILERTPNRVRAEFRDPEMRKRVAIPQASFESMMKKLAYR